MDGRLEALTDMFRVHHNRASTPARSLGGVRARTIWGYWGQGGDSMPDFFKLCVSTWKHHNPGWDVVILDQWNLFDYLSEADLPNRFGQLFSFQTASDAVRLAVLSRFGGVWMDVNVLLRTSLDELCWNAIESGEASAAVCFHPTYGTEALGGEDFVESWFLACKAGNPQFLRWRDLYRELLHNRLDVKGLVEHPLYQGIDLSGFIKLNEENPGAPFDFREYLAIHAMCHRLIETDAPAREQWGGSWRRIDAAETAFRLQLEVERAQQGLAYVLIGGEPEPWDEIARVPLVKFRTPDYRELILLPREVLTDERGVLGRLLRADGVL